MCSSGAEPMDARGTPIRALLRPNGGTSIFASFFMQTVHRTIFGGEAKIGGPPVMLLLGEVTMKWCDGLYCKVLFVAMKTLKKSRSVAFIRIVVGMPAYY